MRLIYDGGAHEVVTCENIVFRGGRVTADISDSVAKRIVAQPHIRIREATAAEIKAKDSDVVAVLRPEAVVRVMDESTTDETAPLPEPDSADDGDEKKPRKKTHKT